MDRAFLPSVILWECIIMPTAYHEYTSWFVRIPVYYIAMVIKRKTQVWAVHAIMHALM